MIESTLQLRQADSRLGDLSLVVVSHKPCWPIDGQNSAAGVRTDGGFPEQMAAVSTLFSSTRLIVTRHDGKEPGGVQRIEGKNLEVLSLRQPKGRGLVRKALLPFWLVRNAPRLFREIRRADVVHAVVPGDMGVLGLQIARLLRKPLLVRHCGTWGNRSTAAYRYLARVLPDLAAKRRVPTVILATGGSGPDELKESPDRDCSEVSGAPGVHWIFSSSLSQERIEGLSRAKPWQPGSRLELIFVGRVTVSKNAFALVEAMPHILARYPNSRLTLLGHGPDSERISQRITSLGLDESIVLPGNMSRDEVLHYLSQSSLMVFPTRVAEGFPKAVLEALACGVPVLAPPVSVLPLLLEDRAGKVLSGTDSESIARDVIECLDDPSFFQRASDCAIELASKYSLERWAAEIGDHLSKAMALTDDDGGVKNADTPPKPSPLSRIAT